MSKEDLGQNSGSASHELCDHEQVSQISEPGTWQALNQYGQRKTQNLQ